MYIENGMPAAALGTVPWRKSRHSNSQGNCVELAPAGGGLVAIRNSRFPDDAALIHGSEDVAELFAGMADGEFDDMIAEAFKLTTFDDPDESTGLVTGPVVG